MTLAQFAGLAMLTATVLYLMALVLHSADRALRGRSAATSVEPRGIASGRGTAASSSTAAPAVAEDDSTSSTVLQRVVPTGRVARAGHRLPATAWWVGGGPADLGHAITLIGWGCAVAGVAARGIAAGRWPVGNMYEFITLAMVMIVGAHLVLVRREVGWLDVPVTLLAALGNGLAIVVFYVEVAPLVPALHSVWFVIHITAGAIAGAAFNVGGLFAIRYLIRTRTSTEKRETQNGASRRPTTHQLDVYAFRAAAFAFPLWTFALAAGAIWAEYAWGRYWGWDPKEVWTLVTWVIYAGYLHARSTAGWRGRRAAIIAVIGLASFWFNFVGVNLLFSGLHAYSGI
ncbi:c-type cytochrome biogenesis protein CcsB [Microlunatus soli]|uniref:Cytochrome c-type biogenesis protein CcsB n=1 Tax=Microlunatus soli TaxID=630515 RepID=A0A1H1QQZ2_9ACTN|nr:cytochrome c-type biogenesis protein CcsB [Microlunatus soli]